MTRRGYLAAAVAIGLLTAPLSSTAEADEFGPGRPFGEAELIALAQAEAYWGQPPTLCTTRTVEVVPPGALGVDEHGRDAAGRATQPQGEPTPCEMWIEEDMLSSACSIVRHEYGHWLGYGHEDPELTAMPACASDGRVHYDGGVYVAPDPLVVARHQAWAYYREWRVGCREEGTRKERRRCFRGVGRYAERLRDRFAA